MTHTNGRTTGVEFELSPNLESRVSVKSHEELLALVPENYEFLTKGVVEANQVERYSPRHMDFT